VEGLLHRHTFDPDWTIGTLYLDGVHECFILEDPDRLSIGLDKIAGKTAIPDGKYEIAITWSPKFERHLPLILNVEGFDGVRIHQGNWPRQTAGCPLPGYGVARGRTLQSHKAFVQLYNTIREAERAGGFTLEIVRSPPNDEKVAKRCRERWEREEREVLGG
jgi:hypothetical protein